MGPAWRLYEEVVRFDTPVPLQEQISRLESWATSATHRTIFQGLEHRLQRSPHILRDIALHLKRTLDTLKLARNLTHSVTSGAEQCRKLQEFANDIKHNVANLNDLIPLIKFPIGYFCHLDPVWTDEIKKFQPFIDTRRLHDKYPGCPNYLAERLGKANCLRRAKFAYSKAQIDAGSGPHGVALPSLNCPTSVEVQDSALGSSITTSTSFSVSSLEKGARCPDWPVLSSNDDKDELELRSLASATSYAPLNPLYQERLGAIPVSLLLQDSHEKIPSPCPLCAGKLGNICGKAWKQHVFHDLEPWMCVEEDCPQSNYTYTRRRDWVAHQKTHLIRWKCPTCNCQYFRSTIEFQHHLLQAHRNEFKAAHADLLSSMFKTSDPDEPVPYECVLCQKVLMGQEQYIDHLASELEAVALFTLPLNVASGTDPRGDTDQESTTSNCDFQLEEAPNSQQAPSRIVAGNPNEEKGSKATGPREIYPLSEDGESASLDNAADLPRVYTNATKELLPYNTSAGGGKHKGSDPSGLESLTDNDGGGIPDFHLLPLSSDPLCEMPGAETRLFTQAQQDTFTVQNQFPSSYLNAHQVEMAENAASNAQREPRIWGSQIPQPTDEPFIGQFQNLSGGESTLEPGQLFSNNCPSSYRENWLPLNVSSDPNHLNPSFDYDLLDSIPEGQVQDSQPLNTFSSESFCQEQFHRITEEGSGPEARSVNVGESLDAISQPQHTYEYECPHAGCLAGPFKTPYLRNSHSKVHSSDRPYVCSQPNCRRGFKRKSELSTHASVHRDDHPFSCRYCQVGQQKAFKRSDNLSRHVRKAHPEIDPQHHATSKK